MANARRRRLLLPASLIGALLVPLFAPPVAASPIAAFDPLQVAVANSTAPEIPRSRFLAPSGAIANQPFPIIDPATGKPVPASATIVNRANGKSVNAGQYWALINRFEASLNAAGQTLREPKATYDLGRLAGSAQSDLTARIHETSASVSGAPNSHPFASSAFKSLLGQTSLPPSGSSGPQTVGSLDCANRGLKCGKPLSPLPPAVTNGQNTVSAVHLSWTPSYGDSSVADVELSTIFFIGGSAGTGNPVDLEGSVGVGGHVLGLGGNLASAKASVKNNTASYNVEVAGSSVASGGASGTTAHKTYPATFLDQTIPIPVGPVDVTLQVTVGGEIDLTYILEDEGQAATAALEPEFKLNATFKAGAGEDLGIVSGSAGVTGNLKIADVSFNPAQMQLGFSIAYSNTGVSSQASGIYACQLKYALSIDVEENHTLLAGTVGVYLQACVDLYVYTKCESYSHQLFQWSGITGHNVLVKASDSENVGPVYTDLPEYGKPLPPGQAYSPDDSSGEPAACHNFGLAVPGAQNRA